jgi:hypothetical protein
VRATRGGAGVDELELELELELLELDKLEDDELEDDESHEKESVPATYGKSGLNSTQTLTILSEG